MELRDRQHAVAQIALKAVGESGFALAGSGAMREHGVIDRPTQDVDLFTPNLDAPAFDEAAAQVESAWRSAGFDVVMRFRAPMYVRFLVGSSDGLWIEVDLAVDWRAKEPTHLGGRARPGSRGRGVQQDLSALRSWGCS